MPYCYIISHEEVQVKQETVEENNKDTKRVG